MKYTVNIPITGSIVVEVKAVSSEEAIEQGMEIAETSEISELEIVQLDCYKHIQFDNGYNGYIEVSRDVSVNKSTDLK